MLSYFIAVLLSAANTVLLGCSNVASNNGTIIQWLDAALNKCLFSASLHAVCLKYNCIISTDITFPDSSVVSAFSAKAPKFNPGQVNFLFAALIIKLKFKKVEKRRYEMYLKSPRVRGMEIWEMYVQKATTKVKFKNFVKSICRT